MRSNHLQANVWLTVLVSLVFLLAGCSANLPARTAASIPTSKPTALAPTQPAPAPGSEMQAAKTPPVDAAHTAGQEAALLSQAIDDLPALASIPAYWIDLQLDYDRRDFTGSMRLDYTNQENAALDKLYFRLLPNGHKSYGNGSLDVLSVQVEGQPVVPQFSQSSTVLEVPLPSPIEVDQAMRIEMDFEGKVPIDFGGAQTPSGYGIYNFSDGVLALSSWYPILAVFDQQGWHLDPVSSIGDSVYSETAFYTVDLTAAADLVVAATGSQVSQENADGSLRRRFVSGPVRDFFLIMSPDYVSSSQVVDGVQVNSYYLPQHAAGGEAALSVASRSLQIFDDRFGQYPYRELDVVDGPMRNALGVEYPGIFLVASDLYKEPDQDSFNLATAHEVAHQWWYGVVGNDVFHDPWLDEGMATYSSSLYYQEALGEGAYQGYAGYWQGRLDSLRKEGGDEQVTESLGYFESLDNPGAYGTVVYNKSALFFKALREAVGDQAFFSALQDYYRQQKYQVATPQDLLSAFERSSGRPLGDLYDQWLYSADN